MNNLSIEKAVTMTNQPAAQSWRKKVWLLLSKTPIFSRTNWKLLVLSFSIIATVSHLALLGFLQRAQNSWAFADWLISYTSGFTRRGLVGTIVAELHDANFASMVASVLAIQAIAVVLFGFLWASLFWESSPTLLNFAALIFPLGLMFPMADLAAGGRKDLLWIGLYALVAVLLWRGHQKLAIACVAILFPVLVLIHEGLFFFSGFLWVLMRLKGHCFRSSTLALLPSIATFAVVLVFSNPSASEICNSLVTRGFSTSICDGAIKFLDKSSFDALQFNLSYFVDVGFVIHGLTMALLVLIISHTLILTADKSEMLRRCTTFAVLVSLPLFAFGVDWGRWLSLLYISILVLSAAVQRDEIVAETFSVAKASVPSFFSSARPMLLISAITVIPVAVVPGTNFGLIQTIANFIAVLGL